jgi:hypothetical protein
VWPDRWWVVACRKWSYFGVLRTQFFNLRRKGSGPPHITMPAEQSQQGF